MFHVGFLKDLAHEPLQHAATKIGQRQQTGASATLNYDHTTSALPFRDSAPQQDDIDGTTQ